MEQAQISQGQMGDKMLPGSNSSGSSRVIPSNKTPSQIMSPDQPGAGEGTQNPMAKKPSKSWMWILIVVLALGVGAAAYFFLIR